MARYTIYVSILECLFVSSPSHVFNLLIFSSPRPFLQFSSPLVQCRRPCLRRWSSFLNTIYNSIFWIGLKKKKQWNATLFVIIFLSFIFYSLHLIDKGIKVMVETCPLLKLRKVVWKCKQFSSVLKFPLTYDHPTIANNNNKFCNSTFSNPIKILDYGLRKYDFLHQWIQDWRMLLQYNSFLSTIFSVQFINLIIHYPRFSFIHSKHTLFWKLKFSQFDLRH